MRKLNDQWIEEIEGVRHMVKAIPITSGYVCHGCMFYDANIQDCSKYTIPCDDKKFIIKDLGTVNEEGCLAMPCDKNVFPEIEKVNNSVWFAKAQSGTVYMESWGIGRKGAVDSWNRRPA